MRDRALAVLGAIALVAVALVLRAQFSGDDGGSGTDAADGGPPVVACTPDLMAVCEALAADGRIAAGPPKLDLDGAAAPDGVIDAWITWDPAAQVANFQADAAGREAPWGESTPVAASPLAVAAKGSPPALPDGCRFEQLTWDCLNQAQASQLAIGAGRASTAEGLARFYPIAASLLAHGEDFRDLSPGQLRAVLESPANRSDRTSFVRQRDILRTKPGALSVIVGPESGLRDQKGLVVTVPAGAPDMVAVVSPRLRADGEPVDVADLVGGDEVDAALAELGLSPGTGTLAPGDRAGELFQVREKVG